MKKINKRRLNVLSSYCRVVKTDLDEGISDKPENNLITDKMFYNVSQCLLFPYNVQIRNVCLNILHSCYVTFSRNSLYLDNFDSSFHPLVFQKIKMGASAQAHRIKIGQFSAVIARSTRQKRRTDRVKASYLKRRSERKSSMTVVLIAILLAMLANPEQNIILSNRYVFHMECCRPNY